MMLAISVYVSRQDYRCDFGEVYVTLGTGPVSVSYYYEVDNDDGSVDSGDNTYLS
ncbi:MAG: hypothetical protein CM15mP55_2550 [Hyphomicrobiales bacterium]|nr:MAG: hypothetical protein CM15mP55_2550 [Hyphomicrobiales bacterium]